MIMYAMAIYAMTRYAMTMYVITVQHGVYFHLGLGGELGLELLYR